VGEANHATRGATALTTAEEGAAKPGASSEDRIWSVLLIDDVKSVLKLHARDLISNGYRVVTAHGSHDGLRHLQSGAMYTLVLCDLMMPGLGGDGLVKSFRAWEKLNRPGQSPQLVYALTAYANAESRARCLAVGMQGVFEKPMRLDDVHAVCQREATHGVGLRDNVVQKLYREMRSLKNVEPKPKILLVDDVQSVLLIYAMWMRTVGFDVTTADNGRAALEALYETRYSLVLCDLLMPGVSGVDMITTFRQWEARERAGTRQALIYALTAYETPQAEEYRARCSTLRVQGILQKPLDVDHLCSICMHEPRHHTLGILGIPTDLLCSIVSLVSGENSRWKAIIANVSARFAWLIELVWYHGMPDLGLPMTLTTGAGSNYDHTGPFPPPTSNLAQPLEGAPRRNSFVTASMRDKPVPPDSISVTYQLGGQRDETSEEGRQLQQDPRAGMRLARRRQAIMAPPPAMAGLGETLAGISITGDAPQ